jgi:predicted transcriptional regulator
MMPAWPAIVLALLTASGACPTVCSADELPELPDPEVAPVDEAPASPDAGDDVDRLTARIDRSAGSLDPIDRLTVIAETHLPGDDDPLELDEGQTATVAGAQAEPDPAEREPPTASGPAGLDGEHAAEHRTAGPHSQGEAAHADPAWPTTQGNSLEASAASLTASLLLGLAGIGLYHKLSKDRALEHPARQRILSLLAEEPGLGTPDVADELDVCYRTARHHLEVLSRFDLVVQTKRRGAWRWARPADAQVLEEPDRPEIQRRLLSLLAEDPGLHLSEIARRLDAAKATVKHHLDRLDEREEVVDERRGPLRCFFPADQHTADPVSES